MEKESWLERSTPLTASVEELLVINEYDIWLKVVDKAGINFRVLNRSKGPAVWVLSSPTSQLIPKGPRAQIDRKLYKSHMQAELNSVPNLTLLEGSVSDLLITPIPSDSNTSKTVGKIQGIALGNTFDRQCFTKVGNGGVIHASQVIITTGTFLGGEIHVGTDDCIGDANFRSGGLSCWPCRRTSFPQTQPISSISGLQTRKTKNRHTTSPRKKFDRFQQVTCPNW